MNRIHVQFNKKISVLSIEHPFEYGILRYLFLATGLLIIVYLYLVCASVLNVIAQREADHSASQLQSAIGELEGKYFSLSHSITRERASELGLTQISESSFVYRRTTVGLNPSAQNAI